MKTALVAGSFDPITRGHVNVIERACAMFDKVYVTVFVNAQKKPRFETHDRLSMIKAACEHLSNVTVDSSDGMLADYCKTKDICAVVKGVRNFTDFEYEERMARFNRERNPSLDTILLCAEDGLENISSSALYDLIRSNGDYEKLVPQSSLPILKSILAARAYKNE